MTHSNVFGVIEFGAELYELMESCSDLIQITSADRCIVYANPAWCQALGTSFAAIEGGDQLELMHPASRERWLQSVERVSSTGQSETVCCHLLAAEASPLVLEGTLACWKPTEHDHFVRLMLHPKRMFRDLAESGDAPSQGDLGPGREEPSAEILRSRQLLQEAQRIAQVGSWSLDLRKAELLWSPEIYRIFELDPSRFEPSYETFLACVHPEDRQKVDRAYADSLIDQKPYEVVHRLLMPDGRIKVIRERCETSFSEEGEPLLSIGTASDITLQTEALERLEQGERKLRSLVELAPLGIVLSNLEGELQECNSAFARMLGCASSGVIVASSSFNALAAKALSDVLRGNREELLNNGCCGPVKTSIRRPDHVLIDLKINSLLFEVGDQGPLVWSIVEDVSESLRIQEQLEQAASVFSHSHEGIMITDASGKILDVNQALCRITGYRREQLLGSNPRRLKSGIHDDDFYRSMWQELQDQGTWSGEVINRGRDGNLLPVRETISAVRSPDGQTRRYVALLTDIRELKEQQQQLENLALSDPLTGLPNRVLLRDRMEQAIRFVQRNSGCMVVALIDLDGFKQVNDRHGHAAGDHLLQVLTERLLVVLRRGETLARLGGDEFVLLVPNLDDPPQVLPLVERLLAAVNLPVEWDDRALSVGGSVGLTALVGGSESADHQSLLLQADQAMYKAKRTGGNRVVWYADFPS